MVDFLKTLASFIPLSLIVVNTYINQTFIHSSYYKNKQAMQPFQRPCQPPPIMFK